eukprot:Selendium_serpulae@DN6435_c1_g1_i13.p1
MEHNDKHIYAHHNAAITGGDAGADVDLFGSVRIYHDNGKKLECAEDADTSEPLEGFTEMGTWSLLNIDRNIGIAMDGDNLRGQDFAADSPSWSDLGFFGRYSMTFYVSAPSKFHKLKSKDLNSQMQWVKIDDEMYVSGEEHRYRLKKAADGASASLFQIRRSGIDDKMGGSPFWITAQHNGKTVVMITEDATDEGWGNVHM